MKNLINLFFPRGKLPGQYAAGAEERAGIILCLLFSRCSGGKKLTQFLLSPGDSRLGLYLIFSFSNFPVQREQ